MNIQKSTMDRRAVGVRKACACQQEGGKREPVLPSNRQELWAGREESAAVWRLPMEQGMMCT
jgi:hypothetical protein